MSKPLETSLNNPVAQAELIKGWMDPIELEWLYQVAQRMDSIIELGCARGRSTYVLLSGCQGPVYALDCHWCGTMYPFEDTERYTGDEFRANVGHFPNLVGLEGNFEDFVESPLIPPQVDMVFVDGSHIYEYVLRDLQLWADRGTKLVCGHDLSPETPGVQQALDEFYGQGKYFSGPGKLWYVENGG